MGLVAVKRLGTVIPWLKAVFEVSDIMLIRKERLIEHEAVWGVVTDASPKGIGGLLINKVAGEWLPVEAYEALVQKHHAEALDIEYGEASGQAVLEGLAILRAVQLWAPKFQGKALVIRSDSAVALAMSK